MLLTAAFSPGFSPPAATAAPTWPSSALDRAVKGAAAYFNVSVTAAFTTSDGKVHAAADGPVDRVTGAAASTESLYPGGSTTKTFTAVAALKLVEAGKLDLDTPIHEAVDPWLKTQGHKSLLELWGGDRTILEVTGRQLLQMRGGVQDYDDASLRQWTVQHPSKDWLPYDYIQSVDKKFLFAPGQGGAYSGISYVLMGWTLCAAVGCSDFTQLPQQALVEGGGGFTFANSRFMTTGPCSGYGEDIVHQYLYGTYAKLMGDRHAPLAEPTATAPKPSETGAAVPSHCTAAGEARHQYFPETAIEGKVVASKHVASGGAAACCAAGDQPGVAAHSLWSFVSDGGSGSGSGSGSEGGTASGESGTCMYYESVTRGFRQQNATSGMSDAALRRGDFTDLYDASCLNGWTMGNIATNPSELTRFYHAVFAAGTVLNASSVAQMQHWEPLSAGFSAGSPYGLALFKQTLQIPLRQTRSCAAEYAAVCKCSVFTGCRFEATQIGHPGLDYGSGFPVIGFVPQLNLSYALGANTGENPMGMNYTLGALENRELISAVYCPFLQAAVQAQLPGFPDFECGPTLW